MSGKRTKGKTVVPPSSPRAGVHTRREPAEDFARAYGRGLRFHRQARRAARGGDKVKKSELYQRLAGELGVSPSQLEKDARFSAAVDGIVGRCGEYAREVLLGGRARLTAKWIEQLSRKSPAMQKAQIASLSESGAARKWRTYSELVREMYPDPVGRAGQKPPRPRRVRDVPPVETWDYEETTSRLKRAGGLVAKNVLDLPRLGDRVTPESLAQLLDGVNFLDQCVGLLRLLIKAKGNAPP
jgi:hypothetical protein